MSAAQSFPGLSDTSVLQDEGELPEPGFWSRAGLPACLPAWWVLLAGTAPGP